MNAKMKQDTKNKILEVANCLFARFGYHGTSIRDIAKEASINLASVNYHFKNKLNLYQELFKRNYQWMEDEVINIGAKEDISSEDLSWEVYSFFVNNGDSLINNLKIILTEDVCINAEEDDSYSSFGPPGQEAFLSAISRDVPESVSMESKLWAVRTIFTNIVHSAMMMNTHVCKTMVGKVPFLDENFQEQHVRHHTKAVLDYIKQNPKIFGSQ